MKKTIFIIFVVLLFIGLTFMVKSENAPKLMCDKNGDFTILVVSDPQCDIKSQWQQARDELEVLVQKSNPNFVLINGDMNSYNKISADMWDIFISPLTSRNIYWSTTNGNHDPFNKTHYRMYKNYDTCLNDTVNSTDSNYESSRPMNYVLPVYSNNGRDIVFAIYGMDSGTRVNGVYEGVSKKQILWYSKESKKLQMQNNEKKVPSILCMHIPLPQMLEMYYESDCSIYGVANEINYNTNGYLCKNGKFIQKINVHTSTIKYDKGMFNEIVKRGDIKAVLFGHNHRNNFIGSYKGVLLGFVGKLSTGCYSDTLCRGGRVIKFNQSDPEGFTVEWLGALPTSKDQPAIYFDGTLVNS